MGKAIRERDAHARSAWDNYRGAIKAALAGDPRRLIALARAHQPMTDPADLDRLADWIEATTKRKRGRQRNELPHLAVRTAEAFMGVGRPRDEAVEMACCQISREREPPLSEQEIYNLQEQVRGLLRQAKERRRGRSSS